MVTVAEADAIIRAYLADYGTEAVPIGDAIDRILAEEVVADRDLPPCNRVTMDGIAVSFAAFESGRRAFEIKATMAAGDRPIDIDGTDQCIEIMTGAALPDSTDTVIRYEDLEITDGLAIVTTDNVKKGQNIHPLGRDRKRGDVVIAAGRCIDPAVISMAASVGKSMLLVKKLPRVVVIATGDELVPTDVQPAAYQVRRSNDHTLRAALLPYGIDAGLLHIPDDITAVRENLQRCICDYDVILLSGGISMGKFDYVPGVLEELGVKKHFHKVKQRPGKPFWFGTHGGGATVFALPGNPVSTFMCCYRYFIPWLRASLGQNEAIRGAAGIAGSIHAVLTCDMTFTVPLQYFMQVRLAVNREGRIEATPVEGNGSGDFANLPDSHAFMELPLEQSNFKKGEVYAVWPYAQFV